MKKISSNFKVLFIIILILGASSCSSEDDQVEELGKPMLSNVEIGTANNGQGIIGKDFHLNVEIIAGERIDMVSVDILPREDEEYAQEWSFTIAWDEFKGLRNTIVHKHFDISEEAVEGIYDFVITVTDENGTSLEEVSTLEIIDPENIAVNPEFFMDILNSNGDYFFGSSEDADYEEITFSKNDTIQSLVQIKNVKDDGKIYLVLINKDLDYYPETTDDIDPPKVIVYDVYGHQGEEEIYVFSNQAGRDRPTLVIGAAKDNHTPEPNEIEGENAWENGAYYYALIYSNTTHDISLHKYVDVTIEGF